MSNRMGHRTPVRVLGYAISVLCIGFLATRVDWALFISISGALAGAARACACARHGNLRAICLAVAIASQLLAEAVNVSGEFDPDAGPLRQYAASHARGRRAARRVDSKCLWTRRGESSQQHLA